LVGCSQTINLFQSLISFTCELIFELCILRRLLNTIFFVSANGTAKADEGHERIPEAINSTGHDGKNISSVLYLFIVMLVVSHFYRFL
jgi:hypothetical protein